MTKTQADLFSQRARRALAVRVGRSTVPVGTVACLTGRRVLLTAELANC